MNFFYDSNFFDSQNDLYERLKNDVTWDKSLLSRKTASFGKIYSYQGVSYSNKPFPDIFTDLLRKINEIYSETPNNCLLNYYEDGNSKMGFHSDDTKQLIKGSSIIIISVGDLRKLIFKKKNSSETKEFNLESGSIFIMSQEVQDHWVHTIKQEEDKQGRISLSFRTLK